MQRPPSRLTEHALRRSLGFSLVEMMIALTLGLILIGTMSSVYLSSKTAFRRQEQLSGLQQSVRAAFDFLTADARSTGMMGCQTGGTSAPANALGSSLLNNHAVGVEGYDAASAPSYPLADVTAASNWSTNTAPDSSDAAIPMSTLGGSWTGGSDVLVLRTAGSPVRLATTTTSGATVLTIESVPQGTCNDGTPKVSGFCAYSHGAIANCARARIFAVGAISASPATVTVTGGLGGDPIYSANISEVFPLYTVVYFVKTPAGGSSPSLYRRIYDGAQFEEQELIEGVESLQVTYGLDPTGSGAVTTYVAAAGVTAWSNVASVRIGLLIRPTEAVRGDVALPASRDVNGVTVTFPTTGPKFDRRVFTTTIALRNKVAY